MAAEEESQETALLVVLATVTLLTVYWELFETRHYKRKHRRDPFQVYSELVNVTEEDFKARYRITISRFNKILDKLKFEQEFDNAGVAGVHPTVKVLGALRQLSSGNPPAELMELFQIGRATLDNFCEDFCDQMIEAFEEDYLKPDWGQALRVNKRKHQLDGLLGSLDCTHLEWGMCPSGYKGIYSGRSGRPTFILEALVDSSLRVHHFFFGYPGNLNDITVLRSSPLVDLIATGDYPEEQYCLNGQVFIRPFILVDGIYPAWSIFSKTVPHPTNEKERRYKVLQERYRKDVERFFGIFKKQWKLLGQVLKKKRVSYISKIVVTCLILHNMNVEDNNLAAREENEDGQLAGRHPLDEDQELRQQELDEMYEDVERDIAAENERLAEVQDKNEHLRLFQALVKECYKIYRKRKRT